MTAFLYTFSRVLWNFILSFLTVLAYLIFVLCIVFVFSFFKVLVTSATFFGSADAESAGLKENIQQLVQYYFSQNQYGVPVPNLIANAFPSILAIFAAVYIAFMFCSFMPFFKHLNFRSNGARVITDREFSVMQDIINEIYEKYFGRKFSAGKIKFYIYDSPSVNAYALANDCICIYRGVLRLDAQMVKGLLSHEIAHIKLKHSTCVYMNAMSSYFLRYILVPFEYMFKASVHINADWILRMIYTLINIILYIPEKLFGLAEFYSLRRCENQADDYSIKNGYGTGLYRALEKLEPNQKPVNIIESLYLSHPHLAFRLDRVHKKIGIKKDSDSSKKKLFFK